MDGKEVDYDALGQQMYWKAIAQNINGYTSVNQQQQVAYPT